MHSRKLPKHGILHLLAQETGSRNIELSGALATLPAHRRRRGRPCRYIPLADLFLDQLALHRNTLKSGGRPVTNVAAFELMLKRTMPKTAGHRRHAHAKELARRVTDFRKYSKRNQ